MDESRLGGRLTLRIRMVGLAVLLVTAVLVAGGVVLGVALRAALVGDLRRSAMLRARDVAALAEQEVLPQPVPIGEADESLVQVVAAGRVLAASGNIADHPPLDAPRPRRGQTRVIKVEDLPVDDHEDAGFLLVATTVLGPAGSTTVYVATSLDDVQDTLAQAGGIAVAGLPVLVLVVSGAMWVIVGRTLAPVEDIRAEAEAISGRDLHRRVPEPPQRDEIGRLARTLNAMLQRLQHSAEHQRRFVADAAHELRSPVASIRAQLETARGSPRPIDWQTVSAGVLTDTLRVQQLTEQLLLLARADAGKLATGPKPVDLDDLVDHTVADVSNGRVSVDLSEVEPVQVRGDPILLEQVVRNLLDNAGRHARRRVLVGLRQRDGAAVLTIDDDGPGIAPEQRSAVFQRFTRLDNARDRDHGGAGLGLSIVADVVNAHHGTVQATDSPLGGARIEVRLPTA